MGNHGPLNVVVAGIGGQGVRTLTAVVRELSDAVGMYCTGSLYKGGAQRMGSVHSELRLFDGPDCCDMYSADIPPGGLDVLVGLEPWEAMRHEDLIGPNTAIVVNTHREPFFLERTGDLRPGDPLALIDTLDAEVTADNFTEEAIKHFGSPRMVNYLMGLRTIRAGLLPFDAEAYTDMFVHRVQLSQSVVSVIRGMA